MGAVRGSVGWKQVTERPALDALIRALARKAAAEHLTRNPAPDKGKAEDRTKQVQLPAADKAA